MPLAGGFAVAAAGMLRLSGADAGGSYVADVLPGMLVAGIGLGVVLVSVSVAVMTGAADDETGILEPFAARLRQHAEAAGRAVHIDTVSARRRLRGTGRGGCG